MSLARASAASASGTLHRVLAAAAPTSAAPASDGTAAVAPPASAGSATSAPKAAASPASSAAAPSKAPASTSSAAAPSASSPSPSPASSSSPPTTSYPPAQSSSTPPAQSPSPAAAATPTSSNDTQQQQQSPADSASLAPSNPAGPALPTLPPAASNGSPSGGFQFTTTTLIGVVVGAAVFVLLIAGCCWFLRPQRRRNRRRRAALEDGGIAGSPSVDWGRSRSRHLSRDGWRQSLDGEPKDPAASQLTPYRLPDRRAHEITHGEARDSVRMDYPYAGAAARQNRAQLFAPPARSHPAFAYPASDRASTWADDSEADMFGNDGSSIARTLSTVTRPNSEYNLENDPGATMAYHGAAPHPHGMYDTDTVFSTHSAGTFGGASYGTGTFGSMSGMAAAAALAAPGGTYRSEQAPLSASRGPSVYTSGPMSPTSSYQVPHGFFDAPHQAYHAHPQAPQPFPPQLQPQHPQQRIPAPRLLIDTKAPIVWPEDPLSANSTVAAAGPSYARSTAPLLPYAATPGATTPIDARSTVSPIMGQPIASIAAAPQTRTLVGRPLTAHDNLAFDTSPAPSAPVVARVPIASEPPASPTNLSRGQTVVRHADGGAFDDALPSTDASGTLHLPPAYGDIYGPPEPEAEPRRT